MLNDVNFFETDTRTVRDDMISNYAEVSGRSLGQADPIRLYLYSVADEIVQLRTLANEGLKQNLLYYATGDNLDHLGYLVDCERLPASSATTTLKITLSAPISRGVTVPAGTKVGTDEGSVFIIDTDVLIPSGSVSATVSATAEKTGIAYNDYVPGMIKNIINPIAYVSTIANITTSEGGSEIENDESYRLRIHEAPESFSTAGSYGGYRYCAMTASSLIADVAVSSPKAGEVLIQPLLSNGELPDTEILEAVEKAVTADKVRPLTDKVTVAAPIVKSFNVDLTYYIDNDDRPQAVTIKSDVENAIYDYVKWQHTKLGRDINPTELYHRIRTAGAKYADIRSPSQRVIVAENEMAKAVSVNIVYGGIEDG